MLLNNFWDRLERTRLGTRLSATLMVGAVVTLLVGASGVSGVRWLQGQMDLLFQNSTMTLVHAKEANLQLVKVGRALRNLLIVDSEADRTTAKADLRATRERLEKELAATRAGLQTPEQRQLMASVEQQLQPYLTRVDRALVMLEQQQLRSETAAFVTSPPFHDAKTLVEGTMTTLVQTSLRQAEETLASSRRNADKALWLTISGSVVGLFLALVLTRMLARTIDRPHHRMTEVVQAIAQGRHDESVPHRDYANEVGEMARALEALREAVRDAADDHWVKDRSTLLLAAIRSAESADDLARSVLSDLAPLLSLGHGAFYRADANGHLVLVSTYAMTERKRLQTTFEPGEGLPGQCLLERKPIHLTLPSDHVVIASGLGEAPAVQVIAWPLVMGDSVLAVMVLASYSPISQRQQRLLEELANPLAATLQVLDRNLRTSELLVLAQTQSEQMQKQAAQLEEQAVEMEAQQAELRQAEAWYRTIIENSWDGILIVDGQGIVVMANTAAEQLFGFAEGALAGATVDRLVPDSVRGGHARLRDSFFKAERRRAMGEGPTLRGRRSDGSEFPLRAWLTPLPSRGARGRCVSVAIRAMDDPAAG